jgi:hypothetical protein
MKDRLVQFAEWIFGGRSPGAGEGIESTLDHSWPWPQWVTLLVLVACAMYVIFIYARERTTAGGAAKALLAACRLALLSLAVFMMYGWVMRPFRTDLPDLVIAVDATQSMQVVDQYEDRGEQDALASRARAAGFSEASRINLAKSLLLENDAALLHALASRYNLKLYVIGQSAQVQPGGAPDWVESLRELPADQPASLLGKNVREVLESQRGRPTAAVILLTDGITTEGRTIGDVAEYAHRKDVSLFTVALGSDKVARDLRLSDLLVEEVVFANDLVNFDFKLTGAGYAGRQAEVRLREKERDTILARKSVTVGPDGKPERVRLPFRPTKVGTFEYVVEVVPLEGEINKGNNAEERTVAVKDESIKVLLVQAYPNYEFRYLKTLLGRGLKGGSSEPGAKAIQLTTVLQDADLGFAEADETAIRVFPVRREELFAYDVIIFGDVNPSFLSLSVMTNVADFVKERGGGVVFISGPRFTPLAYRNTPLADLVPIDLATASVPEPGRTITQPFFMRPTRLGQDSSPQMQLGDTPEQTAAIWQRLPGLYWMLEAPDVKPAARILAEHPARTGTDGRNLPIIAMQFVGNGKVIFHATDETWRWRWRVGDALLARYWVQTIRYLSRTKLLGQDRSAEVVSDREEYRRGETVHLRVRFFDDRNAPPQDDGVTLVLEQEGGRKRRIVLRRDSASRGVFEGAIAGLAEGRYDAWIATPALEGKPPSARFAVAAPPGEQARLETDTQDLKRAAERSLGRFYTFHTADRLLRDLPRGKEVPIESLPPVSIWNSWKLAMLFVGLLAVEWLLRKRAGLL